MATLKSHHIALKVKDLPACRAFYTETLGFPVVGQIPGSETCFIDIGGTRIELMAAGEGTAPAQGAGLVHLAFQADDVDATYRDLAARGVPFTIPPRSVGDIRLAFFTDPDGNTLELFHSPSFTY